MYTYYSTVQITTLLHSRLGTLFVAGFTVLLAGVPNDLKKNHVTHQLGGIESKR